MTIQIKSIGTKNIYKLRRDIERKLSCLAQVTVTRKGQTNVLHFHNLDGRIVATCDNRRVRYNRNYIYNLVLQNGELPF